MANTLAIEFQLKNASSVLTLAVEALERNDPYQLETTIARINEAVREAEQAKRKVLRLLEERHNALINAS